MDSSIRFNVSANTAQFQSGMRQVDAVATTTAARIRGAFSGLGGLLVGGAAIGGLRAMMNEFDRVGDLASRFNTSAESIQRVAGAAKLAGTDIEAVATALTKAGIAATNAASDGGKMAQMFATAGINAQAFAAASIDEKLLMVAEAFRAASGDATKTNAIIQILGSRAGANLLPLINNVQELRKQMAGIPVASNQAVAAIQKANDQIDQMTIQLKAWGAGIFDFFYQGVALAAQRIGALSAGAGFSTIQDIKNQQERAMAESRLLQRGELLTDQQGSPIRTQSFTPNTKAGQEIASQAEENARRIEAELAVMREEAKKAEEAAKSARATIGTFEEEYEAALAKSNERLKERNALLKDSQKMVPNPAALQKWQNLKEEAKSVLDQGMLGLASQGPTTSRADQEAELVRQYEELTKRINNEIKRAMVQDLVPASIAMANQAAMTEPERQRAQSEASAPAAEQSAAAQDRATETTLQKVAKFLEELNTKLPQPVLV